ncbi:class I adenylate-forming enzyme family protein [Mycobacterium deserti]|uniref:Acyl--CoA ligase n=1 Tax=Mycobacterium deserti TaxID=2978347 RepID=A0ABT2M561_9MYCO|nr:class I adenylate-forming enzyme family protein [Mycobacterium deserti]MCT7657086.1 acyl--CoA ligase [Mycobacterium deserti]
MTSIRDALGRLWSAADDARMLQCDGRWVTWRTVRDLADRIDRELTAGGCGPGGRVAVVLGNRMESVAAIIAIFRAQRTLVSISPLQPIPRLSADLVASGADYLLAPRILWSEAVFADAVAELGAAAYSVDGGEVTSRADGEGAARSGDPSIAIEMLTSGTTGPAKRVPLQRKQIEVSLSSALQHNDRPETRDKPPFTGAVGMVTLPIIHIGGLFSLLQSLAAARPIVMLDRFTLSGWHHAIKEHRPVVVGLPPPAIRAVLDSDIPPEDLASVRAVNSGTAPVDPIMVDAFVERYGIPILITYGATEFAGAVAGWTLKDFNASWADKKGSVGRPFPGVRLRTVDEDGTVLPAGQTGRLQVASPQVGGTADNWVTTSDLAHIDDDGYLYFDGRADDVIVRGGFKIAPEIVVRALRTHNAVADAAVAGLPDARLGQVPVAAVELRSPLTATSDELRAHCRTSLTPYEVPARVFVVDELPRGAALKVDRRLLVAALEKLTAVAQSD